MQELRCLFALMVGSTRRFVDPSAAVELLRDAFRTSEAQQVKHTLSFCLLLEHNEAGPASQRRITSDQCATVSLWTTARQQCPCLGTVNFPFFPYISTTGCQ